jgi:outer membrane protein TolC
MTPKRLEQLMYSLDHQVSMEARVFRPARKSRSKDGDLHSVATGVVVALIVLISSSVFAQTGAPAMEHVTFDQAVQRAVQNNPTAGQASANIVRAEGFLQQARAFTLPSASATANTIRLDSARGFNGGVTQPQDQLVIGADVTMPVLAPSRWAATNQARDQVDVSKLSAADIRKQIAVAAAEAYFTVLAFKRQVDVNVQARDDAKQHLDYADQRLAAGAGTRLNQLRAAQELASDETRVEVASLAVRRAQEGLGVLLAAGGPVDTTDDPVLEVPPVVDEAVWMAARTDLQLVIAQQHAVERVWKDTPKDVWPTGSLSFDPQYLTPAGLFQPSKTWRLALSFSQPLYLGGLNKAVTRERKALFDVATLERTAAEIQARSDVRLARESLASSERARTSARASASAAADVLRITTQAFEAGASTNLEVIDAQRSARDAETAVTITEDAVRRAQLDLLVALGRFPK